MKLIDTKSLQKVNISGTIVHIRQMSLQSRCKFLLMLGEMNVSTGDLNAIGKAMLRQIVEHKEELDSIIVEHVGKIELSFGKGENVVPKEKIISSDKEITAIVQSIASETDYITLLMKIYENSMMGEKETKN